MDLSDLSSSLGDMSPTMLAVIVSTAVVGAVIAVFRMNGEEEATSKPLTIADLRSKTQARRKVGNKNSFTAPTAKSVSSSVSEAPVKKTKAKADPKVVVGKKAKKAAAQQLDGDGWTVVKKKRTASGN